MRGLLDSSYLFQAFLDSLFYAFVGRVVVDAIAQAVREALHVGLLFLPRRGRIGIPCRSPGFHQTGGRVAKVERDGFGGGLLDVLLNGSVGGVEGVRFGRGAEIDDGLSEGEIAFGHADEIDGIAGGHAERESVGFGEADIFDRHADDAAGDVEGIFSGF